VAELTEQLNVLKVEKVRRRMRTAPYLIVTAPDPD